MRVPVQQRAARSKPATAANKRAKNKRGISSEGAPPVKIKKRKLQPPFVGSTGDPPPPPTTPATTTIPPATVTTDVVANNSVPVSKRGKLAKKPSARKAVDAPAGGKGAAAATVKKERVKKARVPKLTVAKGKVNTTKKVSPTTEKKVGGVKAKKLQSRKLSGADLLVSTGADVGVVKEALISEKAVAENQVIIAKKSQKKPKAVVNKVKEPPRGTKVKEDVAQPACRKRPQKAEKKAVVAKRTLQLGVKSIAATREKKKTRRKATAAAAVAVAVGGDAGESVGVLVAGTLIAIDATSAPTKACAAFPCSQLEVIDGVARNLIKGGGYTLKKTKESDESCAIKNKIVGSYKSKKQLTKKTPKNVEDIVKREGASENVCFVNPPTMSEEKIDKTLENDIKGKLVAKKALKEKKVETGAKKKVMFKKASPKVPAKTATKVTFQVKQSPPKKRMSKKNKEALMKQQVASGSSFQDDYNSSTSDDCTLDLLLRRQKQLKQEELGVAVKSEILDVKPIVATSLKREASPMHTPTNQTKHKIKLKVEKPVDSPKPATSILKKKVVKKLNNKCKTKLLTIKKQSPAVLKKLKLATRKKVIVTKVKRMRPNEVSRLGTGTDSEQRARRMKLFGFWSGPKRHRVASLNALAKVHCLYENESRGALMSVCTKPPSPEDATGGGGESSAGEEKPEMPPAIPQDTTTTAIVPSTRTLRSGPGRRGIGQHWDQHTSSSSSSDDSAHSDSSSTLKVIKKLIKTKPVKPLQKSKPRRHEVVMDLKDMVVRKRMASLNASAILSASYSPMEKLKKRGGAKDDDSPVPPPPPHVPVEEIDAQQFRKKKGKKKIYLSKKMIDGDEDSDDEGPNIIELATANNKKVATVIVNQDTDVTITGVYVNSTTHRSSTTHEGYCSIAGMQYRISSTSHTQTEATAVATETLLHAAPDLVPAAPSLHPSEPPLQQPIKSYTPLGALSNMQPPGGPLSPLGRRHGCSSAFTAPPPVPPPPPPHHHHHHAPPPPPAAGPPDQQPPYMHGYYQPAGPLISAHHHHGLPKPSVLPPLEASPTSTPPTAAPVASTAPPPAASASTSSGTRGGDESSDNDVVITATSCNSNPGGYPPNPGPNQAAPPAYRYQAYPLPPAPQHMHHQYPYTQYPQQYYPGAVQGVQYAGAPPQQHHYHNPELCYSAPNYPPAPPYYHKTYSTPPPVSYPRRYGPPHPAQYYPPDLYPQPPDQQASRQMVATASTSGYQPPVETYPPPPAPPVVPMVDPYPPPPAPYYPGYPPPAPPCYSHSPPARSLAYIDTAYQCPCPMQSCPKNVHTGPLTGEGKGPDPSAAIFHHLPLPPVALALPSEPPHALGPPSPARGSAGMHPTPSPLATAQGNDSNGTFPTEKREQPYATQISSESRAVMQDLSSKGVGLLTIHKPQGEQPKAKAAARPAGNVGTVYVGNNVQTLTRGSERALDFASVDTKVDTRVEGSVKMEVGDGATKASVTVNGRKRKVKSENVAAPKPKRRNVAAKKVSPKSEQLVQGDAIISSVENIVLPSEKTKCKNQPLSSANSCSLHNSKQNAKKRKLSNAEVLAENQEPAAVPTQSQSTQAKEPKSRPKLCPSSKQEVKTKIMKVSKKSVGISEQHIINPAICDFDPVSECSKDVVNLEFTKAAPTTASKSLARGVPKSAPRMTQKTIMNINSPLQSRKKTATKNQLIEISLRAASVDTVKAIPVVNGKKPPPKTKLSKSQQQVAGGVLPSVVGSVKRRRKTDSDASKVSHMLRSHGIQECHWPTENDLNTGNLKASLSLSLSATTVKSKAPASKKQAAKNGLVKSAEPIVYHPPTLKKGNFLKPKWSNGWCWEGEAFQAKVHLNSEEAFVERLCYPAMRHAEGDVIRPLDCVLLKSGARKADLPFVAKVAQLWENADDGEMMVSLLWYYRPEHTDHGRRPDDMRDEIFASKHKDTNSVACIEDKCYVLTFNEYCRYRGNARRLLDGVRDTCAVVPPAPEYPRHGRQPPHCVSPDMVFFCRRVYDFRQKRILKNPG